MASFRFHMGNVIIFLATVLSWISTTGSWKIATTNVDCQKAMEEEVSTFKTAHEKCGSKFGAGKNLDVDNAVCAMLCLHKEKGFINDDNEFSHKVWAKKVSKFYPSLIFSRYSKFVSDCVKRHNEEPVKTLSKNCSEMKEFLHCYEMAELEACGYKEIS